MRLCNGMMGVVLCASATVVGACAGGNTGAGAGLVVEQRVEPRGAVEAGAIRASGDVEVIRLRRVEGRGAGVMELRYSERSDGGWVIERVLPEEGDKPVRTDAFRVLDDGSIAIVRTIDHGEGVEVHFDPHMVVLPASLEPGRSVAQSFEMRVHPVGDPDRTRASGSAEHTVTYEAEGRVVTPAGTFDAHLVRGVLEADLGPSRVRNETLRWYSPGRGLVAEWRSERTRALLVTVRSSTEAWVAE